MISDLLAAAALGAASGLASVPHCAVMCGPVSAAACARSGQSNAPLRYQLGRIGGYGLAGLVAGRFGVAFGALLPPQVGPWALPTLTSLACLLLFFKLWPQRDRPTVVRLRRGRGAASPRAGTLLRRVVELMPRDATLLGALTAMLPCGALAGALLLSAGAGRGVAGALLMAAFALTSGLATTAAASMSALLAGVQRTWTRRLLAVAFLAVGGFSAAPARYGPAVDKTSTDAHSTCH